MFDKSTGTTGSATLFQSLYLANLLLLPGVSFLILIWFLYIESKIRNKNKIKFWCRIHLIRSVQLSTFSGVMLVIIPLIIIWLMPVFDTSLMVAIVYFVTAHALFVLLGMLNLSRAMTKKLPIF